MIDFITLRAHTVCQTFQATLFQLKDCTYCFVFVFDWINQILKLYAWEPSFQASVGEIREKELSSVRTINLINALSHLCWFLLPFVVKFHKSLQLLLFTYKVTDDALTSTSCHSQTTASMLEQNVDLRQRDKINFGQCYVKSSNPFCRLRWPHLAHM